MTPVSYRATFRRHRRLLCLPMVVSVLVVALIVFGAAKHYKSYANLWVDSSAPAPSSVGAGAMSLGAGVSPATQEQGILNELLTTRSFVLAVGHGSELGPYLAGHSSGSTLSSLPSSGGSGVDNKIIGALPKGVASLVTGPQVLQITYSGPTPAVAASTLSALVGELQKDNVGFTSQHNQAALAYYKSQVQTANQQLSRARDQVTAYMTAHPGATSANDPNLGVLTASEAAASTSLLQANTALNQASGGGWSLQVIDPPALGVLATSKKKEILTLLGGLLAGALISFLGTIALTPGRREQWEDEFPSVSNGALSNGVVVTPAAAGDRGGLALMTKRRLITGRDGPDPEQQP